MAFTTEDGQRFTSPGEIALWGLLLGAPDVPPAQREIRFSKARRWRFDVAWEEYHVAVEVEGWGRHQSYRGYATDCAKYNAAALSGWLVLRFVTEQIEEMPGHVLSCIRDALRQRGAAV